MEITDIVPKQSFLFSVHEFQMIVKNRAHKAISVEFRWFCNFFVYYGVLIQFCFVSHKNTTKEIEFSKCWLD